MSGVVTETAAAETAATLSPLAVGAAIRTLRGVLGMTVKDLAAQLDVEWPKLVQIETGALAATEDLLAKVRDKFAVDLKAAVANVQPMWEQLHSALAAEVGPAIAAWQSLTGQSNAPAAEPPAPEAPPAEPPKADAPAEQPAEIKEFVQPPTSDAPAS